jgi:L-malate glycosyltransferase
MSQAPLITHILPTLSRAGAERVALELVARLPARGFRTRLLVLFGAGPLSAELRERNIRWGTVLPHRDGSRLTLLRVLYGKLFRDPERRPCIVHTHLFGGDVWTPLVWMIARLLGSHAHKPVLISTAHSIDRDDSALRRVARRWGVRRMDRVVAVSQAVAAYVHEELGVPTHRIVHIPNGITMSAVRMRPPTSFRATPQLLMVGRLEIQKGHDTVLTALAAVQEPWELSIVSTGSQLRRLKELAERLGITSRVRFLGERQDVPDLLAQADLVLSPSRWEGLGLACMEALAAAVPLLASDIPAYREFVPKALLVAPDDVAAWTHAIRGVLQDPQAAVARAYTLAPTIRKRYDIEIMIDRYAELYRSRHAHSPHP